MFIVLPANGDQKELVLNVERISWFALCESSYNNIPTITFKVGDDFLYWKCVEVKTRDQEYNRIKNILLNNVNENY